MQRVDGALQVCGHRRVVQPPAMPAPRTHRVAGTFPKQHSVHPAVESGSCGTPGRSTPTGPAAATAAWRRAVPPLAGATNAISSSVCSRRARLREDGVDAALPEGLDRRLTPQQRLGRHQPADQRERWERVAERSDGLRQSGHDTVGSLRIELPEREPPLAAVLDRHQPAGVQAVVRGLSFVPRSAATCGTVSVPCSSRWRSAKLRWRFVSAMRSSFAAAGSDSPVSTERPDDSRASTRSAAASVRAAISLSSSSVNRSLSRSASSSQRFVAFARVRAGDLVFRGRRARATMPATAGSMCSIFRSLRDIRDVRTATGRGACPGPSTDAAR